MSVPGGPDLNITNGAGQGPGGIAGRLVADPGQNIYLGGSGGTLLLGPPGGPPGSMSLTDMQNRTWHLLREDGPDTGFTAPTTGDFNVTVVTRDLNIALAQFVSQTGIAPKLTERMDNFPAFAVLDYPLPPSLVSLTRVEYTPAGQQTYKLQPKSFNEWDNTFGTVLPSDTGQPYYYREPFANYIRLQPQPGPGNFTGPGTGTFVLTGTPQAGQQIYATLTYLALGGATTTITTNTYTVIAGDTLSTLAVQLSNLIWQSAACTGINAFLAAPSANANQVTITALIAPGSGIQYSATLTGIASQVSPTTLTTLTPGGDVITFYYSSLGTLLINPNDVPQIPPQFHMAPVYRVLMDYWARKQDMKQSKHYEEMFDKEVARGKAFTFDMDRASSPNLDGSNYAEVWPEGGG